MQQARLCVIPINVNAAFQKLLTVGDSTICLISTKAFVRDLECRRVNGEISRPGKIRDKNEIILLISG